MQTHSAELTAARARIAVLERELQALRSATATPDLEVAPHTAGTIPLKPVRPLLKPRPAVMTRRASAAAAAMDKLDHLTLDDALSAGLSEHSSSRRVSSSPSDHSCSSTDNRSPSPSSPKTAIRSPSTIQNTDRTAPIIEAVTPEITASPAPNHSKIISNADRKLLSSPIVPTTSSHTPPSRKEQPSTNTTPTTTTSSPTVAAKPTNPPKSPPPKPASSSQRRRPPPLPLVKTSSTKKERYNLVAKCTEPKPGQTRYWTDEEHERFLEAVAEYGEKAYVAISNYVETRTPKQVRTHAQKFQMKMARLAKQSIEAGQPIQMPAGMRPIVQLPPDVKPLVLTVPPAHPIGSSNNPSVSAVHNPVPIVVVQPPHQQQGARKSQSKKSPSVEKQENAPMDVASAASDESSSALTDPYMNYIGGTADSKVEMDLENSFAAKLSQTLHDSSVADSRDGDFLMSDGGSNDSTSMDGDDDLEDLEKLEDGDLSLAPFSNASDNWLLPDAPDSSSV